MVAEDVDRGRELVASGVGAGAEQGECERKQFVVVEPLTVVFGANSAS